MVALVTAAFGADAYVRADRSQQRVAALQADLASLEQRVGADEQTAAADRRTRRQRLRAGLRGTAVGQADSTWQLQSLPTEAQLAGLRNDVANYAACVPPAPERDRKPSPELANRRGQPVYRRFQAVHRDAGVGVVLGPAHWAAVRFESAT